MAKSSKSSATPPSGAATAPGAANPKVDWYFDKHARWEKALRKLRRIALGCRLTEDLKWGCPCYSSSGSKIVLIHVFKEYCALLFFKGALLEDDAGILVQQTKNVQAARQMRFSDAREVVEHVVKAYILSAVGVEKSGLQVAMKKTADFAIPEEFTQKLQQHPALNEAFHALTPGRQRGYLLHFSAAKQSKTREARVEKAVTRILDGRGLDD
jgi:uncharacterized protein YdeI (YjbR/CyaY-like superfamily)